MTKWESDDETITQWSFYEDTWQGSITEHEDYFSWWVMVPAVYSHVVLTAEGDAGDREQAERLAEAAAKMLMTELNPPKEADPAADFAQATIDGLRKMGSEPT